MIKGIAYLYRDSLFRNSLYIMLATAVLAGFGFFFWLISAHLVSTATIGLATGLVSVMNMIAVLSLIGFDTTLIRFLGRSQRRDEHLNTSIVLVGLAALIFSGLFVAFVPHISAQLGFIGHDPLLALLFIIFCITSSLNILTDAAFIGYRQTKFSFIVNAVFSVIKMLLPFAFAPWGAFGIFSAAALAQTVGFILSIGILIWKFDYHPRLTISRDVLTSFWKYSLGNYVSGVLNLLPLALLPIIVINHLGAEQAAYFYIVMTIAGLLFVIPAAVTRSLFAEGSFDEENVPMNLTKSIRLIAVSLAPAIIILLFLGPYLLRFFGAGYSTEGIDFLYIIIVSAVIVSCYSVYGSLFRIKHNLEALILANAAYAGTILGLTYLLIRFGLFGIGIAWIAGNSVAVVLSSVFYRLKPPHDLHRYWKGLCAKLDDLWAPIAIVFASKLAYLRAASSPGFRRKTILFYPEKPKTYHVLYILCHLLGCRITNDPRVRADAIIDFEDTTVRKPNAVLSVLRTRQKVININCNDISKERVDRVFKEVFGYGISVDPLVYHGTCVRKSNTNALHDGRVVECPTLPEAGHVYQKLVNNVQDDGSVMDSRVLIFNSFIPFIIERFRTPSDRFDAVIRSHLVETGADFTQAEIRKILEFCRRFGLDLGELDIVRDRDDGRIYIVDANNTPSAPRPGRRIRTEDYRIFCRKLSEAFASEFLKGR